MLFLKIIYSHCISTLVRDSLHFVQEPPGVCGPPVQPRNKWGLHDQVMPFILKNKCVWRISGKTHIQSCILEHGFCVWVSVIQSVCRIFLVLFFQCSHTLRVEYGSYSWAPRRLGCLAINEKARLLNPNICGTTVSRATYRMGQLTMFT